jgi:hypothetical protein
MGWLFMSRGGMAPFATPKAYLDNQCTYPPDPDKGREKGLRVLKSTVRSGAYYAACQSYDAQRSARRHSRSSAWSNGTPARDGEEFGYKDMTKRWAPTTTIARPRSSICWGLRATNMPRTGASNAASASR